MVIIKNSIKLLLAFSFVASFVSSPLSAVSHRVLRNDSRPEAEIERERQNQNLKIAETQGRHARKLKELSKTVATIGGALAETRAEQRALAGVVTQNRNESLLAEQKLRDDNIKLEDKIKAILKDKDVIVTEQKTLIHRQNLSTKKIHKTIIVGGVVIGIVALGSLIYWKVLNGHAAQLLEYGVRLDEQGKMIAGQALNLLEQGRKIERVSDSIAIGAQATSETLKQIPNVVTEQTIQTIAERSIPAKLGLGVRWLGHFVSPTTWFHPNR